MEPFTVFSRGPVSENPSTVAVSIPIKPVYEMQNFLGEATQYFRAVADRTKNNAYKCNVLHLETWWTPQSYKYKNLKVAWGQCEVHAPFMVCGELQNRLIRQTVKNPPAYIRECPMFYTIYFPVGHRQSILIWLGRIPWAVLSFKTILGFFSGQDHTWILLGLNFRRT